MRLFVFLLVLLGTAGIAAAGAVHISEVLYDWPSSDDGKVFVELYGPAGFDLSGYSVIGYNGSGGSTTHTVSLTGSSIPADGFFVLADRTGGGTTFVKNADLLDQNFDLQNGPDSVQLLYAGMVVDALGYGNFGPTLAYGGEGSAAPDVSPGYSLARRYADVDTDDNSKDFVVLSTPTPGYGPTSASASSVPLPASGPLALFGAGLVLLAAAARRRRRRGGGAPPAEA